MGRLLQLSGALLMLVAISLGLGIGPAADAEILAPLAKAIASIRSGALAALPHTAPTPIAQPTEEPSAGGILLPNATPTPHGYSVRKGGRLVLSLTGSLSLGKSVSGQTFDGGVLSVPGTTPTPTASPSPGGFIGSNATSSTSSMTTEALGLYGDVSRRTATTSMDLRVPLSFSLNHSGSIFGQLQALFSTPKYALGYGAQSSSILGQLPAGGTQRGFYEIMPTHGGDATFFQGPTIGAQGEIIPLYGVRIRDVNGRTLYTLSLLEADGAFTGKTKALTLGSATSIDRLSLVDEIALELRSGGDATTGGLSYQIRADDGSSTSYLTAVSRRIAPGYVAFGNGEYYGDGYEDFSYHRGSSLQSMTFDISSETIGLLAGGQSTNRQSSLNYNGPLRFGSYSLAVSQAGTQSSSGSSTLTQSGTMQVSASAGKGFLQLGSQLQRSSSMGLEAGAQSQSAYNAAFQQPFGRITAGVSAGIETLFSDATGRSRSTDQGVSLSEQFGKASLQLGDLFSRADSVTSQARSSNLQVAVSRAISPAISLQAQYGFQTLVDPLNPASNGHSHTFAIAVNAPFSYGNGLVSGRADPRLPATIVGRVLTDTSGNIGTSFISSSGISNVLVILDDKTVQRTDVSGNFQFSFVSPGQHQVRLESGSLPRGVTVDIPVNSVQLEGGQTAQMTFLVGNFGGIQGHIYGRDDSGTIVPLPSVQLRVDGGAYSLSDQSGAFGFGRLRPGKHVVTVIDNTVPAFASFDKDAETQTVEVRNGVYTAVDFTASPLGSIAGSIKFASDMGPDAGTGVSNAYVVAEPGEHAAIDDMDGDFVIDNLPPGVYTVSVDNETIPDGLGAAPDSVTITLGPKEHYEGAVFQVGHEEKKVVFSLVQGGTAPSAPRVHLSEPRLPLLGTSTVTVDAPADAGKVEVEGVGDPVELVYDPKRSLWFGELRVPTNTRAGSHEIKATVLKGTQPQSATLLVDPKIPIAIMQASPPNVPLGSYVVVRARFLVDVVAGDRIQWADGQTTILGKPIAGRIFTFSLRVSLRPLHGLLLTKGARLPISLM